MTIFYIIIGVIVYVICAYSSYQLAGYFARKRLNLEKEMKVDNTEDTEDTEDREGIEKSLYSAKEYIDDEHEWKPKYNLVHSGVRLFNLPFVPDDNEIIYLENEYDKDANKFVKENINLIRSRLATRGFTFIYLPEIKVKKQMVKSMISYYTPQTESTENIDVNEETSLPSNFLLDYMIHPENRDKIHSCFAWYGHKHYLFDYKKTWYYFNYIIFDAKEALSNPLGIINDMLPELGTKMRFKEGFYSMKEVKQNKKSADYKFDEETQKILEDIQHKLDDMRLKGISEAVITQYIKPRPVLSHLRITDDFHIFLDDYNNLEITMEPLVKAVYLLFIRHEDGIAFKDLSNYKIELETIYRAIKAKHNDIDEKLSNKLYSPSVSHNVKKLVNPLDNSINEKCTRIKEAFIVHFHESIAANYYIQGARLSNKIVILPRNLIIWEGNL